MGRTPCCDKTKVKRGPWSPEEDEILKNYLHKHGTHGNWIALPPKAGLKRCGKSCRLRWLNYLRPDIKHGAFSEEEDDFILTLYNKIGSRWSIIASQLPGRTDNDVKNHWNTKLKKKFAPPPPPPPLPLTTNRTMENSSTSMLLAYNETFSAALTSIKMPFLADHDLSGTMFDTKNIAYDPNYYPLPRINEVGGFSCNFSPSQEGSSISGSSSVLAMEDNYITWSANGGLEHHPHHQQLEGISFDMISHGYPCEFMDGPWSSQQAVVEALPSAFSSSYYVDTKPQGLCPDIPTNL